VSNHRVVDVVTARPSATLRLAHAELHAELLGDNAGLRARQSPLT